MAVIQSKAATKEYCENWESVFGKKPQSEPQTNQPEPQANQPEGKHNVEHSSGVPAEQSTGDR